jgi:hypothetical protein
MLTYLVAQVGLRRDALVQVHNTYNLYMAEPSSKDDIREFKRSFCYDVRINFVGIW